MMLIDGRPLVEDALTPEDLFTTRDIEVLKAALGRSYTRERFGKESKVEAKESAVAGKLLFQARLNGYYPRGVDKDGHIRWYCVAHPKSSKLQTSMVSLMLCINCGKKYQEAYYPPEEPLTLCPDCRVKAKSKLKSFILKGIKPEMTDQEREARIAELRRQADAQKAQTKEAP